MIVANLSFAQQIYFSKFGYDDLVLYGPTPTTTLFLKVGRDIDSSKSYLVLKVEASPVLNFNDSFISIYIWDKPILTIRLPKTKGEIVIPLGKFTFASSEFLKVEIKASLSISEDRCKDIETGGLWIKILKDSYAYIRRLPVEPREVKIYSYFNLPLDQTLIVLPSTLSTTELEGAVWLYSFLKIKFNIENISFQIFPGLSGTVKNLIGIALFDKIPQVYKVNLEGKFLKSDGLIYIYTGRINGIEINILFITGFSEEGLRKAINVFLTSDLLNTAFEPFLLVREARRPEQKMPLSAPFRISLKELGLSSTKVRGIGSLRHDIFFNLSKLGFSPSSITVNISATHSPVSESMGRAFVNIFFNNNLIESKKLGEEGELNYRFSVNRFSLTKLNNLSIEFVYYPSAEECKNRVVNFFCQIDENNSYIEVDDFFKPKFLDFIYFPEMFSDGETYCVIEPNVSLLKLETLARLVYLVNRELKEINFYPKIITTDRVDKKVLTNNIIAIVDPGDVLIDKLAGIVARFKNGFRVISEPTGRVLYVLWDTSSVGIAQVFYGGSKNAFLLLAELGVKRDSLVWKTVLALERRIMTLKGNLGIVDLTGKEYFFQVSPGALKVKYPGEKTFLDYFREYKIYIIIVLWFLFLSLVVYIFFRGKAHASKAMQK